MPIVKSHYTPPFIFKNGHFSTVYSGLFRKSASIAHQRERITLPDNDFLDIDWSYATTKSNKLIIILHGLEGNSERAYITWTAKLFNDNGFDAASVNFRSCSGEMNTLYRSYNAGATEDLEAVIHHVLKTHKQYDHIVLKGFSLGGNMVLKYMGEGNTIPDEVRSVISISAPCSLYGSLQQMNAFENSLYTRRFVLHLHGKLYEKQEQFPEKLSKEDIKKADTLLKIDDLYSSKAHGYKDALDYYTKCSSLQFLPNIERPTLLINALNDSFLSENCYPTAIAEKHTHLYLETPKYGGHVGFYQKNNTYYTETRALDFATSF